MEELRRKARIKNNDGEPTLFGLARFFLFPIGGGLILQVIIPNNPFRAKKKIEL